MRLRQRFTSDFYTPLILTKNYSHSVGLTRFAGVYRFRIDHFLPEYFVEREEPVPGSAALWERANRAIRFYLKTFLERDLSS